MPSRKHQKGRTHTRIGNNGRKPKTKITPFSLKFICVVGLDGDRVVRKIVRKHF